nr:leucine-rich repeat protein [Ruminococcus bicirculans (ex Wegman et al. 2014)]
MINITVSSNNKKYLSKDGVLFNYNGTELIQYPLGDGKSEYVIPNNVEKIGKYAFYNCKNLRSVTINESVKVIAEYAFSDCINLNNLFIQRQTYNNIVIVPYIGFNYYSFYNCSNLTDIYYMGSLNDWQNLWKAEYNDALENATIHYNYGVHVHSYTESITKQPTCTEEGEKTFTCDCGDTYTEIIPAKGHTEIIDKAVPATCTTDGKTEGSHCYVCGEVIKAQTVIKATGHNFGSWSTTKAATCTESGTQTRKCASCGKTETKTIPAKGHTSSSWIIDKQPAVGVKGSKHKECTVCHARLETATIPALAVTKQSISKASVTLSTSTYAYDGKAKKPGVTVKLNGKTLKNGTDYTVSYSNNTKVGTATVKITGKGNYTGSVSKTFKIKNNFKKATVLGISTKAFTGKNITQSITVKYNGKTLKNGTDYTVSYSSNKNIGTATVKIAGKGSYTGTITKTFKINPAKQEIQKLTAKSKAFFVDWAQKESATGYEIQYATNSKFSGAKKVTVTNNKTDKKTVSKLSGKKKYYVRVRSYTTVKGKKYYGAWSSTKSVTTKK